VHQEDTTLATDQQIDFIKLKGKKKKIAMMASPGQGMRSSMDLETFFNLDALEEEPEEMPPSTTTDWVLEQNSKSSPPAHAFPSYPYLTVSPFLQSPVRALPVQPVESHRLAPLDIWMQDKYTPDDPSSPLSSPVTFFETNTMHPLSPLDLTHLNESKDSQDDLEVPFNSSRNNGHSALTASSFIPSAKDPVKQDIASPKTDAEVASNHYNLGISDLGKVDLDEYHVDPHFHEDDQDDSDDSTTSLATHHKKSRWGRRSISADRHLAPPLLRRSSTTEICNGDRNVGPTLPVTTPTVKMEEGVLPWSTDTTSRSEGTLSLLNDSASADWDPMYDDLEALTPAPSMRTYVESNLWPPKRLNTQPFPLESPRELSPKARRQIRNKISARNFRQRRKQYMEMLETQVQRLKQELQRERAGRNQLETKNKLFKAHLTELTGKLDHLSIQEISHELNQLKVQWDQAVPKVKKEVESKKPPSPLLLRTGGSPSYNPMALAAYYRYLQLAPPVSTETPATYPNWYAAMYHGYPPMYVPPYAAPRLPSMYPAYSASVTGPTAPNPAETSIRVH
jgi:hypothetical protein